MSHFFFIMFGQLILQLTRILYVFDILKVDPFSGYDPNHGITGYFNLIFESR